MKLLPCLLVLGCVGCEGMLSSPVEASFKVDPTHPSREAICQDGEELTPSPTGLVRLTHLQLQSSIHDALGHPFEIMSILGSEASGTGFANDASALRVGSTLRDAYIQMSEHIAHQVVTQRNILDPLLPSTCDEQGTTCAQSFVTTVGRRLFRRPLAADEVEDYMTLFSTAFSYAGDAEKEFFTEGTPFEQGIRIVLEAMLRSPNLIWRTELGHDDDPRVNNIAKLTDHEVASKLSYFLWNSSPDDALIAAAEANEVHTEEQIRAQAERLIADPRISNTLKDFHEQWLEMEEFGTSPKDPELPHTAGESMRTEALTLINDVFTNGGSYATLVSAPYTYMNNDIAAMYGQPGDFTSEFQRVELDPSLRSGILTQAGLMSTMARVLVTSPIERGIFILRNVMCFELELPEFEIDPTPPPFGPDVITTRHQVEAHTADKTCQGCHRAINSLGFAFEHIGPRGEDRTHENGAPIDASGDVTLGGARFQFSNVTGLVENLLETGIGESCYAEKWLAYSQSRHVEHNDQCTILSTAEEWRSSGAVLTDLLVRMTTLRGFRERLVPEEQL